MERNPYSPPQTPVTDLSGRQVERPASRLRKVIVSTLWIALLNGAFLELYVAYNMNFNPTFTESEAYEFGETYAFYFSIFSVALVVSLAVANRLPGAKKRISK